MNNMSSSIRDVLQSPDHRIRKLQAPQPFKEHVHTEGRRDGRLKDLKTFTSGERTTIQNKRNEPITQGIKLRGEAHEAVPNQMFLTNLQKPQTSKQNHVRRFSHHNYSTCPLQLFARVSTGWHKRTNLTESISVSFMITFFSLDSWTSSWENIALNTWKYGRSILSLHIEFK